MKSPPIVGVQLGAHSVFDEGADHCLDLLRDTAHVNAVLVYSHTYQGFARGRTLGALADHGKPLRDPADRDLAEIWVTPHEEHYKKTHLRHVRPENEEYAGRDVLETLIEPARRRGIRVIPRILEGSGPHLAKRIPGWTDVLTIDIYGKRNTLPCWNHPDYRAWWLATVEDLFCHYDIDGFQFGAERAGPLSNVLFKHRFNWAAPNCFCEHCCRKAHSQGIDVDRARRGFTDLFEFIAGLAEPGEPPADGIFIEILRRFFLFPEILAWERFFQRSQDSLVREIYGAIKTMRPEALFIRHVDHQQSSWDAVYRAVMPYAEMAESCDYIKPIVYHDILGPRLKHWHVRRGMDGIYGDFSEEMALQLHHVLFGHVAESTPSSDEMDHRGFGPEYVVRETRRVIAGAAGKAGVLPGVGFDVPWKKENFPGDPDLIYRCTRAALEAGADGVVLSREYDEMRVENLEAAGRAVAETMG